jgi:hypothetical protein
MDARVIDTNDEVFPNITPKGVRRPAVLRETFLKLTAAYVFLRLLCCISYLALFWHRRNAQPPKLQPAFHTFTCKP